MAAFNTRRFDAHRHNPPRKEPLQTMLNDLEFLYTPVQEKVRDLREYL
jgi:hypothetical protein